MPVTHQLFLPMWPEGHTAEIPNCSDRPARRLQTPILVSLVKKDAAMLDAFGKGASEDIATSKRALYEALTYDPETAEARCAAPHAERASPPPSPSRVRASSCPACLELVLVP